MSTTPTTSVIHDIGYKPYTGPRYGHAQIIRALYFHSLRSIFGLGRGARAKVVPFGVLAIMLLPAAINAYLSSTEDRIAVPYSQLGYRLLLFAVVFVAVAAPELVTRDLRHRTLPLYFSRPLRRRDYPLAKLLALGSGVFLIEFLPLLVTYLGQVFSATSGHEVWLDTKATGPGLFVAVCYAAVLSPPALLLAAATKRRVIATGSIAILFLLTLALSGVLENVGTTNINHHYSCQMSLQTFQKDNQQNGPGPLCPGVGPNDNIVGMQMSPDFGTNTGTLTITTQTQSYSDITKYSGVVDPFRMVEGVRIWGLDASDGLMPDPGTGAGLTYLIELIILFAGGCGVLFLRYRKASAT